MSAARQGENATLLPDGDVLATAGIGGAAGPFAESYDPATGQWSPAIGGSLPLTCIAAQDCLLDSTATLLGDGDVLVVGGLLGTTSNGGSSASALLYNPAAGTWTATGSLNTGRIDQTASLLQDGQVLVAGGETFGGHKPHLRPSTAHRYRDHIDRYLIPSIGRITLADLTGKRLQACFNLVPRQRTKNGTPIAASTVDRVRATLRSALNAAVREGLIGANPLAQVRLDKPVRPHPVIWTDERVEAWRRDGVRPPVAVWTLRQLVTFLTGVENDRLAALWWLIALRGLRRGEAAALDRDDLDSESRELTITRQLIALPGELYRGPPKSRASIRTIALDEAGTRRLVGLALRQTVELLRHQFTDQRRSDARTRTGPGWRRGRPMFTYADGRPIRPEYLTHRFRVLIRELDLPPIRLHDLRHGAATLALASHTDLKVIQQMLGHSSIVTTADTYTSVLPETAHRAAQATADMVMKAARTIPGARRGGTTLPHIRAAVAASGYCQT